MDIREIEKSLKNCPCGREHRCDVRSAEIAPGITSKTGEILIQNGFPKNILLVADENTLKAGQGVEESLARSGFKVKKLIYKNLRRADMEQVEEVEGACEDVEGILSVGTGSLNDICRLAAFRQNKEFAVFATAPSMDGFASNSAPITKNNFKFSYPAVQPSVIIADTRILAAAPAELKSAGFGDMIGKYIGLVDWKIARLLIDEYYCERVAELSRRAVEKIVAIAPKVTAEDEESAGAVMEALVMTGLCMGFAQSVRPASGAEHVVSHFWEVKKLQAGLDSDFHGKKVGVATVFLNRIYREAARIEDIEPREEKTDWQEIQDIYGPGLKEDVMKANTPATVTQGISPGDLKKNWGEIRRIINDGLPSDEELSAMMNAAGAATKPSEVDVSPELTELGLKYSAFMRRRLTLLRLRPMLNF